MGQQRFHTHILNCGDLNFTNSRSNRRKINRTGSDSSNSTPRKATRDITSSNSSITSSSASNSTNSSANSTPVKTAVSGDEAMAMVEERSPRALTRLQMNNTEYKKYPGNRSRIGMMRIHRRPQPIIQTTKNQTEQPQKTQSQTISGLQSRTTRQSLSAAAAALSDQKE